MYGAVCRDSRLRRELRYARANRRVSFLPFLCAKQKRPQRGRSFGAVCRDSRLRRELRYARANRRISFLPFLRAKQKRPQWGRSFGAEKGIRTPGSSHFNGFQDRRYRPLSHLCIFSNYKVLSLACELQGGLEKTVAFVVPNALRYHSAISARFVFYTNADSPVILSNKSYNVNQN